MLILIILTVLLVIIFNRNKYTKIKLSKYNSNISKLQEKSLHRNIKRACKKYDYDDVLDIYTTMIIETNCRNIIGDNGDSIGYFQLQIPTTNYMYDKYKNEYKLKKLKSKFLLRILKKRQMTYCVLLKKYLSSNYDKRGAVLSYNAGENGFKTGKYNSNYWRKYQKVYNELKNIMKEE